LLKTFWTAWLDEQLPDGTVIWTSPSGHKYCAVPTAQRHTGPLETAA
jgi:hypothetical protein